MFEQRRQKIARHIANLLNVTFARVKVMLEKATGASNCNKTSVTASPISSGWVVGSAGGDCEAACKAKGGSCDAARKSALDTNTKVHEELILKGLPDGGEP